MNNKPIVKQNHKQKDRNLPAYVFNKVAPQAIPLEQAVLGAMLLGDRDAVFAVQQQLQTKDFYTEAHQIIFDAIMKLEATHQPIDLLTVTDEINKKGKIDVIGGAYYLVELTNRVASAANVEYHARIVHQKSLKRQLIKAGQKTIEGGYDDAVDVFDLLDESSIDLQNIFDTVDKGSNKKFSSIIDEIDEEDHQEEQHGITLFGEPELDRLMGTITPGRPTITAARPGMGKSTVAGRIIQNVAFDNKIPTLFWSLDMKDTDAIRRLLVSEADVSSSKLRNKELDDEETERYENIKQRYRQEYDDIFFVEDQSGVNARDIGMKIISLRRTHGLKLAVIDYGGLIKYFNDNSYNTNEEIDKILSHLKVVSKNTGVAIIYLWQTSREAEKRGGAKRMQLSDLKKAGALEEQANRIIAVYRPEYYQILEDEEGNSLKNRIEIISLKNNNGPTGSVWLDCNMDKYQIGSRVNHTKAVQDADFVASLNNNSMNDSRPDDEGDIPF